MANDRHIIEGYILDTTFQLPESLKGTSFKSAIACILASSYGKYFNEDGSFKTELRNDFYNHNQRIIKDYSKFLSEEGKKYIYG